MTTNNLLVGLHRYASRQDENFVTEAFAHLIRHLLENEPDAALRVLESLTAGTITATTEKAPAVTVTTQVTTVLGRPDIEISTLDTLVYVESKVESELGDRQLERYLEELEGKAEGRSRALVLLSRYPTPIPASLAHTVISRRWYQVADWLLAELGTGSLRSEVSRHIAAQFVDFLSVRGITMEAIGWEMIQGIRSFRGLMAMIREAIVAVKLSILQTSAKAASYGFYLDQKKYWVGIDYDRPGLLVFMTCKMAVAADAIERTGGRGRVEERRDEEGKTGRVWINELALDSEDIHFFARSRASQMQCAKSS